MFDQALLDSSPLRVPVLKTIQRVVSVISGCLAFLIFAVWLHRSSPFAPIKVILAQSAPVGVAAGLWVLMICYVHADARQVRLSVWKWMAAVLIANAFGFLAYLLYSARETGDWKRATVPIAYMFECAFIGALVLLPLIYTEALPKVLTLETLPLPPGTAASVPRSPGSAVRRRQYPMPQNPTIISTPPIIPRRIPSFDGAVAPSPLDFSASLGGPIPGIPAQPGAPYSFGFHTSPPPPLPAKPHPERIRRSSQLESAKLIFGPKPEYPAIARMARIQGTVRMEAVIGKDGTVENLRVLSGPALLIEVAKEAVARWQYQPTVLNGDPVEVITEIDVNFTLSE